MASERHTGRAIVVMAAVFFLVLLLPALLPYYELVSDELYYLACANRLALGYVDHPPLFVFVLRVHRDLFGDSLFALRMLPAATGALTAFVAGWMAGRLGGARYAQVLATLAVMVSGISLAMFSWFSVNCLELFLWTASTWILLELCRSRDGRLWLILGVTLGLGFLAKHTTAILAAGVAATTMVSTLRRDLSSRWPWLGGIAFAIVIAPNIAWQIANDWPSLAFYRSVAAENIRLSPLDVLLQQVLVNNPATVPLWAGGVVFFLATDRGQAFRPLGWLFLVVLAIGLCGGQGKPYRISGIFPVVFAGGAVLVEAIRVPSTTGLKRLWNTYALPAVMVTCGFVIATLALPVVPPDLLMRHPLYAGEQWRREPGPKRIPYILGMATHQKAFVDEVANVYLSLPPPERHGAIILTDFFGHAGAVEYYGPRYGLPPVYSPHANFYLWGPPEGSPPAVIAVGIDETLLRAHFEQVRVASVFHCAYCPAWQDDLPIHVATGPRKPFAHLWRELGRVGGMDRHRRLLRAERQE